MYIYGVKDIKAVNMDLIFLRKEDAEAERAFIAGCQNMSSMLGMFPQDHELWRLGELEVETGIIVPHHYYITTGRKENNSVPFKNEQKKNNV